MTQDELKLEHLYFQGYGHEAGDCLMAAIRFAGWSQSFSDLLRAVRSLKGYWRWAPGMSRGPLPWVAAATMRGVAMVAKDEEFLAVQYVAYLKPSMLFKLTVGQVIRPLQGSGASCCALHLALLEKVKTSKTGEFEESVLLDGHLSGSRLLFLWQAHQCWKGHFLHRAQRVQFAAFVARAFVLSFHAKDSWTNKQRWLG